VYTCLSCYFKVSLRANHRIYPILG